MDAAVYPYGHCQLPGVLRGRVSAQKKTGPDPLRRAAWGKLHLAAAVFPLRPAVAVFLLAAAVDRAGVGLHDAVSLYPAQSRKADAALSAVAVFRRLSESGRGPSQLRPRLPLYKNKK